MPIRPVCDRCKNELNGFGAILFGPPGNDGKVRKFHICIKCYKDMGFT